MHTFDYKLIPIQLQNPEVVRLLTQIHEYKGKQDLYIAAKSDVLEGLLAVAKIQSTKASNQIEGIFTSDERLEALVKEKVAPRNRSEEEIVGYREVLATIHESYDYIPIRSGSILQLHRDLYSFSGSDMGGRYKNSDNVIAETDNEGKSHARFVPVPAFQTPDAIDDLCQQYDQAIMDGEYDPLLLIPMFVLDFLCIHPFNDGNGRMSRLLTLLLLYRGGYIVGKYVSIEMLIEKTKEGYYEALKQSSIGWHESSSDYLPFTRYYLGVILKAYREFSSRVECVSLGKVSNLDRVRDIFQNRVGKVKKGELMLMCPDISEKTITRCLVTLMKDGFIEKVGSARATAYIKK